MSKRKKKAVELPASSVKQRRFLAAFSLHGNLTAAARTAGCHVASHRYWLANDPDYPERFKEADEAACDVLRAECHRRAVEGIEKPVFYKGKKVRTKVVEYSDGLLMFLMRARMPEFRERLDVNQTGEQRVTVVIEDNWYGNSAHDRLAQGAPAPTPALDQ